SWACSSTTASQLQWICARCGGKDFFIEQFQILYLRFYIGIFVIPGKLIGFRMKEPEAKM
ncbi:MAG TPA: hypothetical protein VFJ43_02220, partial [Bacteroidia bacterium]|nr:hypothetical protein [Bacteroidia bacterium]